MVSDLFWLTDGSWCVFGPISRRAISRQRADDLRGLGGTILSSIAMD